MRRAILALVGGCGFHGPNAATPLGSDAAEASDAPLGIDAALDGASDAGPVPPINLRQHASGTTSSQTPQLAFPMAQLQHGLNVVVVGWINPNTIDAVTDGSGNTYTRAIGPTTKNGMNQAIYYSCDVYATATNTVHVVFQDMLTQADIRIAEYSGLRTTSCLDQAVAATGSTVTNDSGPATTQAPHELLLASNCTYGTTQGGDPSFTNEGITGFGDVVEDRVVNAIGTYRATATQDSTNDWVMQLVTFVGY